MAHYSPALWAWSKMYLAAIGTYAILITVLSSISLAQERSQPETPGQIEQRFQLPQVPRSTFQPLMVPGRERLPLQEAAKIKFTVRHIVVANSTVYTESELRPLYEQFLHREISLAHAYQIADAIAAKYRHDGYSLAQVIVPDQTVNDGTLTIAVIEAPGHLSH